MKPHWTPTFILVFALAGCALDLDDAETRHTQTAGARSGIIGGSADRASDAAVALRFASGDYCSGALVSPRLVLTAAHCVTPRAPHEIVIGDWLAGQTIPIAEHVIHPEYDAITRAHDLAVLVLSFDAALPHFVLGADPVRSGDAISILGYGRTATSDIPARNRAASRVDSVQETTFRTEAGTPQPCLGDSGGPTVVTTGAGEVLVGIHSFGDLACSGGSTEVRVDAHRDFIQSELERTMTPIDTGNSAGCSIARGLARTTGRPAIRTDGVTRVFVARVFSARVLVTQVFVTRVLIGAAALLLLLSRSRARRSLALWVALLAGCSSGSPLPSDASLRRDSNAIGPFDGSALDGSRLNALDGSGFDRVLDGDADARDGQTSGALDGSSLDGRASDTGASGGDSSMAIDHDAGRLGQCPEAACDVLDSTGCGGGRACHLIATGAAPAAMCIASGTASEGAPCGSVRDCSAGLYCDDVNGVCRTYCCGSDAACPVGQRCSVTITGSGGVSLGVGYCVPESACALVEQTGCPSNQSCYLTNASDGVLSCLPSNAADAAEGQRCVYANDCAPGLGCLGSPGRCYRFCALAPSHGCATTQSCVEIASGNALTIGVCMPPPAT